MGVLFLHHRYRTLGGEERAVEDLLWLVREHLGEQADLLGRDSARIGAARAAAGLVRGGLDPEEVAAAVRRGGARVVHAHNLLPTLGWRALAAAREAGARVVLHLHNYRVVCAVGTCFTEGADCTRCHGRDTRPGVRHVCRGSLPEAVAYAAGLSVWQPRLLGHADAVVVPSHAALERLRTLGAPLPPDVHVVPHVVRDIGEGSGAAAGEHVLVAGRLAPEKGVDVAVEACRRAGVPLVVAGEGPLAERLRAEAHEGVRFAGRVAPAELAALRDRAALAVVPSRSAETFGLSAAEAMAAGVPVVASRIGALADLVEPDGLVAPGDPAAMADAIARRFGDEDAGRRGQERVRSLASPPVVAKALAAAYGG